MDITRRSASPSAQAESERAESSGAEPEGGSGAGSAAARSIGSWAAMAAAAALAVAAWSLLPVEDWLRAFSAWANGLGPYGLLAFGVLFFIATLLVIPGTPLTIAGAVAFGWAVMPVVLLAATLGSWLAFAAARHLFRDRVRGLIERRPKLKATVEAVGDGGWRLLTLMRLSPFVPFNAQNYALGVTEVGAGAYLVSTVIGMLPGTVVCVYLGVIGRHAGSDEPTHWITLGLGLVATVAAVELTRRRVRAKLEAGKGAGKGSAEGKGMDEGMDKGAGRLETGKAGAGA